MKKFIVLTLLLVFAAFLMAETVVIGDGTAAQRFPLGSFWGYERSAALYTDADLGAQNTRISALAWYSTVATTAAVPTKIYLKTTSATALTSDTWANMITGATLVYDATHTGSLASAWNEFILSNTFDVDDGLGVLVLV